MMINKRPKFCLPNRTISLLTIVFSSLTHENVLNWFEVPCSTVMLHLNWQQLDTFIHLREKKSNLTRVYPDGINNKIRVKSAHVRREAFSFSQDEHMANKPRFVVQKTTQKFEHTHLQTRVETWKSWPRTQLRNYIDCDTTFKIHWFTFPGIASIVILVKLHVVSSNFKHFIRKNTALYRNNDIFWEAVSLTSYF